VPYQCSPVGQESSSTSSVSPTLPK
jgi:hypothetical protein